jgi:hypothetical protein
MVNLIRKQASEVMLPKLPTNVQDLPSLKGTYGSNRLELHYFLLMREN